MRAELAELDRCADCPRDALKIRHHGDFHLGQVLMVKEDAVILDFEGEPRRSLDERRQKAPAARDIAGLIRSIDYSTTAALERASGLTAEERALLNPSWRHGANKHRRLLGGLPRGQRSGAMAGRRRGRAEASRLLHAGEGVLRNRVRIDEPAELAARSIDRNLAYPVPTPGGGSMTSADPDQDTGRSFRISTFIFWAKAITLSFTTASAPIRARWMASRAWPSSCSRRMPAASAWSATSTIGTAGAT